MHQQLLNGSWQFRQVDEADWRPAQVPGGVHTDLLALGLIPDPFKGDNEVDVMWVAERDWEYRLEFTADTDLLSNNRQYLVCDGLDTLAEVRLNGQMVGRASDMYRRYRWDVGEHVQTGRNVLHLVFRSPVNYVSAAQEQRPMHGVPKAIIGAPHLRKSPSQFGWDWGPMLAPIGIWKDIYLQGFSLARLTDTHLRQQHTRDGSVTISAKITVERLDDLPLQARLTIDAPDGSRFGQETSAADGAVLEIQIANPELWWPNGYGEQPLYDVKVELIRDGAVLDKSASRMGLRTIELSQEPDQWGKSFSFVVNGVPIFAKGANWIPGDSFPTRFDESQMEYLIHSAAAAHQNMLRVWGGGFYESDDFYDLCDRYGILVWQDFMFACSIYPMDEPDFLEDVRHEAVDNVRRLRHRASLALWCGNNEMEWGWESWGWARHDLEEQLPALAAEYPALQPVLEAAADRQLLPDWQDLKRAYDSFFHDTLPEWLTALDPDTPYWPSSPSSGTPFDDVNGQAQGNAHYWDVWHGHKPFTAYREVYPRFMSEFGFQSLPTLKTVQFYADEPDWNMTSYIMEHHQRGNHGNGLIVSQLTETFRMPRDFESMVYLSLVLQAEGIRYGVEHWRRHMARVSGTLYWQLNDCWPVASWSSIDYFGRWKALHYAARRFYAPVLLSIEDAPPQMTVHLTSDNTAAWHGELRWSLETLAGSVVESGHQQVAAEPLASGPVRSMDFGPALTEHGSRDLIFVCELWQDGRRCSHTLATFVPNKHLKLADPHLEVTVSQTGDEAVIQITAASLARFVELSVDGADTIFSDNYFDVPAGRKVEVRTPLPSGWSLERFTEMVRARSLFDSFA